MVKYVSPAALPETENQFQSWVLDVARYYGWLVHYVPDWTYRLIVRDMQRNRRSGRDWPDSGWPDLFLLHPVSGRVLVLELKSATGAVRAPQKAWVAGLQAAGLDARVVRPKDRDAIEQALREGAR